MELSMKEGKHEMFNKLSPIIEQVVDERNHIVNSLQKHVEEQDKRFVEIFHTYDEAMIRREKLAKEFCQGKATDDLKEWLADQPVAYNSWKNADRDTLVKFVMNVYDDEEL